MGARDQEKSYDPAVAEAKWYAYWEGLDLFHADPARPGDSYCIVIPPPNVTGSLHMGHALNVTLQDVLIRYNRMLGRNVLWLPGTDHAGIATQNVVERLLANEGTDRRSLGREKFEERVWKWKEESGGLILNQLKRLGASCDWGRERFTMDEGLSRAVREAFVRLHRKGLIYRGRYIINWCPRCNTALSDLEVAHEETKGGLYYIRYPELSGRRSVVVATTRPETMLGDTAVAVHPKDERYAGRIGATLRLPLMNRPIPLLSDEMVDPEFGTGAVKITPAHDPNDFEVARRHDLPSVRVIDDSGKMTGEAGAFAGMDRFACREAVIEALRKDQSLVKEEQYVHNVGHCYRCRTVVEPTESIQWFVKTKPIAEPAIRAVQSGETRIIPKNWERTYFDWMENIRDWCISRQIWWGHRIPAWHCTACGLTMVEVDAPDRCSSCGAGDLRQEEDVLDTWFSSGLWPFSTLGWPDRTEDLARYYPTSALVTGFDILFFWVARMMMMGIEFTGKPPFRDVVIHALVRDPRGEKMSKTRGNVIDPLDLMERYGTDAFRFTLLALAAQGRDIRMSDDRLEGYRNFMNKLFQAGRFVRMHVDGSTARSLPSELSIADRWILSRLQRAVDEIRKGIEEYRFNEASSVFYQFTWHEFCDWYLEMVKPRLGAADLSGEAARGTAVTVLRRLLALMHPIMPFVTEEIADRLPGGGRPLAISPYPVPDERWADAAAETEMALVIETVAAVRNIRGEMNIKPSLGVELVLEDVPAAAAAMLERETVIIRRLANAREMRINTRADPGESATAALSFGVLRVPLVGVVDFAAELRRLDKDLAKLDTDAAFIEKKLEREDFVRNAPAAVVAKDRRRLDELREKRALLAASRERVVGIIGGRG